MGDEQQPAGQPLTINEALVWQKTINDRLNELISLRNQNSYETRQYLGGGASDKVIDKTPTYDVKALDRLITRLSREKRKLEQAIKATNAVTKVIGYLQDDAVLGELS